MLSNTLCMPAFLFLILRVVRGGGFDDEGEEARMNNEGLAAMLPIICRAASCAAAATGPLARCVLYNMHLVLQSVPPRVCRLIRCFPEQKPLEPHPASLRQPLCMPQRPRGMSRCCNSPVPRFQCAPMTARPPTAGGSLKMQRLADMHKRLGLF